VEVDVGTLQYPIGRLLSHRYCDRMIMYRTSKNYESSYLQVHHRADILDTRNTYSVSSQQFHMLFLLAN
jgi:hypothetical protein